MDLKISLSLNLNVVNVEKVYSDVLMNNFPIIDPKLKPIEINNTEPIFVKKYELENTHPIYVINDRTNNQVKILTSDHQQFTDFMKHRELTPIRGKCDYCRYIFEGISIGIPISYEEKNIIKYDHNQNVIRQVIYIFQIVNRTCSFECSLAYIRKNGLVEYNRQNPITQHSEQYLKILYRMMHPNEPNLKMANDYRLLKENNGTLERDEWTNGNHQYIQLGRVIIFPAKEEYLELKLNGVVRSSD